MERCNVTRPALPYAVALALLCIANGTLLTLCDRLFHVSFGVLGYSNPMFTGQAWWVWPNFIGASLGMVLAAKWWFVARIRTPSTSQIVVSVSLFVSVYAASGLFADYPRTLLLAFVLTWALRLALNPNWKTILPFSILLAIAGCVVEGVLTLTGEFAYRHPDLFHAPMWLAGLYLHGAFALLHLVRVLEGRYERLQTQAGRSQN